MRCGRRWMKFTQGDRSVRHRWLCPSPRCDGTPSLQMTRGFGILIRIKHRSVSSGFVIAATSYVHQSIHEEPEHEVSFPAVSSVLLSHLMATRFQRISGYIWIYTRFC